MMNRTRLGTALLAGLAAGGMAVSANAATFYYDAYGGFIIGTGTPGAANSTVVDDADTRSGGGTFDVGADNDARNPGTVNVDVAWGTAQGTVGPYDGRSGLALSRVLGDSIVSDGTLGDFGVLTHFNRPISSGTGLEHIEMEWNLALFANQTDANNAETSNNANAIVEIQNSYTIYNWETANAGYGINGYYYSTDGGATWTGNTAAGSCPNSRSDGTLVSPVNNPGPEQIFIANGTDSPGDDCSDAHAFVRQAFVDTTFTYDDGGGERPTQRY